MKLTLSARERFELAGIFFSREIKVTGFADERQFNRCCKALGLTPIMDCKADDRAINPEQALDRTRHVVSVSEEDVDFLFNRVMPLPRQGYQAYLLGELFDCVATMKQTQTDDPRAEGAPALDVLKETWRAPQA